MSVIVAVGKSLIVDSEKRNEVHDFIVEYIIMNHIGPTVNMFLACEYLRPKQ